MPNSVAVFLSRTVLLHNRQLVNATLISHHMKLILDHVMLMLSHMTLPQGLWVCVLTAVPGICAILIAKNGVSLRITSPDY